MYKVKRIEEFSLEIDSLDKLSVWINDRLKILGYQVPLNSKARVRIIIEEVYDNA